MGQDADPLSDCYSWNGFCPGGVNYMTAPKDQGACPDCWDFAVVGAMEGQYQIDRYLQYKQSRFFPNWGVGIDLSEQDVLSCTGGGSTCHYGSPQLALEDLENNGTTDETCNPYTASDAPCGANRCSDYVGRSYHISGWLHLQWDATSIKNWIYYHGPVIVVMPFYDDLKSLFLSHPEYWYNNGGVPNYYSHANDTVCGPPGSHCAWHNVVIVGWYDNAATNTHFWVVRNSWGTDGGDVNRGFGGYFYETQDPATGLFGGGTAHTDLVWGISGVMPPRNRLDLGDLIVWRPSGGTWYVRHDDGRKWTKQWGTSGDVPVIGDQVVDFDNDKLGEEIVWRPSNGYWYVLMSAYGYDPSKASKVQWGKSGDIPLVGDVDGDGLADLIVWRPSNGYWYVLKSSTNYDKSKALQIQWGKSGDTPLVGQFDGDSHADLIVWRESTGTWYVLKSSTSYDTSKAFKVQWGKSGDIPLVGDVDGDGNVDFITWRPSNGYWYALKSFEKYDPSTALRIQWGQSGDKPLVRGPGSGSLTAVDLVVWRESTGTWYILQHSTSYDRSKALKVQWGKSGDTPLVMAPTSWGNYAVWPPSPNG